MNINAFEVRTGMYRLTIESQLLKLQTLAPGSANLNIKTNLFRVEEFDCGPEELGASCPLQGTN